MESIQCANHSIGTGNYMFGLLMQSLAQAQCSISPPDKWPKDYGPMSTDKGTISY